jgi:hypothetical protein
MKREDFENYMKFRTAAKKQADEIEKFIESRGYTARNIYEPEVVTDENGRCMLVTHFIVSQDFPLD